jgi:hypothetical protein
VQHAQKVRPRIRRPKSLIAAGATVLTLGLAVAGTASARVGSWIVLAGWVVLIYGLHSFGRAPRAE